MNTQTQTITKHILVLSGITLGAVTAQGEPVAYVPQQHKRASKEVIADYLQGNKKYNPMKYDNNWRYSENRKEQLKSELSKYREQIRAEYQKSLIKQHQVAEEIITDLFGTISNLSHRRISNIMYKESKKLGIKKSKLEPLTGYILKKHGIVVCNLDDSIFT